ncbi:MAG: RlmE family RNA methyltransferase [Spirochaetes bacterium]|nr:RlmE family RNA methyltransferase [Spirochaetota bacterium]
MNDYSKPDFYANKAKLDGYVARSVYKLEEINAKFKLIKPGQTILDLGSAPGSWSQYVSSIIGDNGKIVGVDYKDMRVSMPSAIFLKGDFYSDEIRSQLAEYAPFNGIISDMAPDTEGDKITDCFRSSELVWKSLNFAYDYLKRGGYFIAKIFQGGDEKEIMKEIKSAFKEAKWFKPASSRKISYEIFVVGENFISNPNKNKALDDDNDLEKLNNSDGYMPW